MKKQVYKKVNFWDGCCTQALQKKRQPVKQGRKCSVVLEQREDRAEWRARLRSKESKSHLQEQTSSEQ